jgi:hypothetical protein
LRGQNIADAASDLLEASPDPPVLGARELAQKAAQNPASNLDRGKRKGADGAKK